MKSFFSIIALGLVFLSSNGNVYASDVNLGCVTETPTTTFIAETKNGIVQFDLIHHFGVKYMPIHSGVITPNDLGTLSDRASLLADLGDHLTFTMPAENCQLDGNLFNCFGSRPSVVINGHQVSLWAAYNTTYSETSLSSGTFNYVTTNLAIEVDGQSLFLPMRYFENECYQQFSKNKTLKNILRK